MMCVSFQQWWSDRKTEDRRPKTEDGRRKTEDGRPKTEDGRRKTEDRKTMKGQECEEKKLFSSQNMYIGS